MRDELEEAKEAMATMVRKIDKLCFFTQRNSIQPFAHNLDAKHCSDESANAPTSGYTHGLRDHAPGELPHDPRGEPDSQ